MVAPQARSPRPSTRRLRRKRPGNLPAVHVAERRSHLILLGLIVAALAGAALLAIPGSPAHKKPTLGLDLEGGLEVVLRATPPPGKTLPPGALDRSVTVIRNRIDKLGVSEPLVTKQGSNEIVVELAGVHNAQDAINIIGKTAQLELYDLETSVTGPSRTATGQVRPTATLYGLLAGVQSLAKKQPSAWYLFNAKKKLFAGPRGTKASLLGLPKVKRLKKIPKGFKLFAAPHNTVVVSCGPGAAVCPPNVSPATTWWYLFKHDKKAGIPQLTGEDLHLSGTRADVDPDSGLPEVLMHFTGHGGDVFQQVTAAEGARGHANGTP